jgi:hypothetical protein
MNMRMRALAFVVPGLLAACAHVTTPAAPVPQSSQWMITRLIIDYTPAATTQTDNDTRFNGAALRRAIADGLAAQGLLDLQKSAVVHVAAIEVDEFDVRATSNVVLLGRVASQAVLGATVRIRDGSSAELRQFHVRTDMPLKVDWTGKNKNPLGNLYKQFTSQIADLLAGRVSQPAQPR